MKKITSINLFSILVVFSLNVSAAATLVWDSIDGTSVSSATKFVTGSNYMALNNGSNSPTINGTAIFFSRVLADNDPGTYAFTHDWNFTVDPAAIVTSVSITFLDALYNTAEVLLDGTALTSVVSGYQRQWSFDQLLKGSPNVHTLTMRAQGVQAGGIYNVHLTTTPIPAAVWLFGSALLGVGGLASRRKSLPAEELAA